MSYTRVKKSKWILDMDFHVDSFRNGLNLISIMETQMNFKIIHVDFDEIQMDYREINVDFGEIQMDFGDIQMGFGEM